MLRTILLILGVVVASSSVALAQTAVPLDANTTYTLKVGTVEIGSATANGTGDKFQYSDDSDTDSSGNYAEESHLSTKNGSNHLYQWTYTILVGEELVIATWSIRFFDDGTWESFHNAVSTGSGTYAIDPV